MEHRTRSPSSSSERWPHLKTTALHGATLRMIYAVASGWSLRRWSGFSCSSVIGAEPRADQPGEDLQTGRPKRRKKDYRPAASAVSDLLTLASPYRRRGSGTA